MDPSFLIIVAMFATLYLVWIRPQQKRERDRQALLRSLAEGDEIVTNAGIHGVVVEVEQSVVWVEVAPNVELKIVRDAIVKRTSEEHLEDSDSEDAYDSAGSDADTNSLSSRKTGKRKIGLRKR